MNRYWVFGFDAYYPAGGIGDFQGSANSLEEAAIIMQGCSYDRKYIVDSQASDKDGSPLVVKEE